ISEPGTTGSIKYPLGPRRFCPQLGGVAMKRRSFPGRKRPSCKHLQTGVVPSPQRRPMAKLNILKYPDPKLHTVAKPVAEVDERIRQLVDDMLETMYAADGVGLAATQVDVHERVIVMDTSEGRDTPRVLINPELTAASDDMTEGEEGCLSVPQIYDRVPR